jgi:SAM-dependent methyltransferase
MSVRERILFALSRTPDDSDYGSYDTAATTENALALLHRAYPNLRTIVSGKRVVDFGCGTGMQGIALVKEYGCTVVGIDSNRRILEKAAENARAANISAEALSFVERASPDMMNSFDVIISQNSFEHFGNPSGILDEMRDLLNPSGVILLTFGPPWLAPYGSHMQFFCKVPWVNVLFPEEIVMKVRSSFRRDSAMRYEDVESGLNRMTIAKFERIVSSSKLRIAYKNYDCIKGINFLGKLPLLREFFVNHVTAVLSKAT